MPTGYSYHKPSNMLEHLEIGFPLWLSMNQMVATGLGFLDRYLSATIVPCLIVGTIPLSHQNDDVEWNKPELHSPPRTRNPY